MEKPVLLTRSSVAGTLAEAGPLPDESAAERIETFADPVFAGRERRYRARKGECYGYRENGQIVAYFWISEGPCRVPLWKGVTLDVPDEVIYIWDCRTLETHRNRGYFTRAIADARRLSCDRTYWIACEDGNTASVRAISKQFTSIRRYHLERATFWRFSVYRRAGDVFTPRLAIS